MRNNILWYQYIVQYIILFNIILFIVRQRNIVLLFIGKKQQQYIDIIIHLSMVNIPQHNQLAKHNGNIPMPPGTLKATTPFFYFIRNVKCI